MNQRPVSAKTGRLRKGWFSIAVTSDCPSMFFEHSTRANSHRVGAKSIELTGLVTSACCNPGLRKISGTRRLSSPYRWSPCPCPRPFSYKLSPWSAVRITIVLLDSPRAVNPSRNCPTAVSTAATAPSKRPRTCSTSSSSNEFSATSVSALA